MKRLSLLLPVFLILLAGCKDDDNPTFDQEKLKQGWKLTSQNINGTAVDLSQIPISELLYFMDNSVCYLATPIEENDEWVYADLRTAWSYDDGKSILNIAGLLPATNYIDDLQDSKLVIHYYMYNESGGLDLYEKTYLPAKIELKDLKIRLAE